MNLENVYRHSVFTGISLFTAADNPGFLHIKYLNPREGRAEVVNCPARNKATGGEISFTYRLGHVTVDMASGQITVGKVWLPGCIKYYAVIVMLLCACVVFKLVKVL